MVGISFLSLLAKIVNHLIQQTNIFNYQSLTREILRITILIEASLCRDFALKAAAASFPGTRLPFFNSSG
jgi:hypothetical protein